MTGRRVVHRSAGVGQVDARRALARRGSRAARRAAIVLDGDAMRRRARRDTATTPPRRDAFYRALAELAALIARQGPIVLVAGDRARCAHIATLARRARAARSSRSTSTRRSPSARAAIERACTPRRERGEIATLPGLGGAYEPPLAPDVIAHGGDDPHALAAIARQLSHRVRRSHDAVQSLRERPRRAM